MEKEIFDFTIEPYVGAGPISFGMSVQEIRQILNTPVESFLKSETSQFLTDAFDTLGVHVYYKPPGICEAVEFGLSRANPIFQGLRLLDQTYSNVEDWFKKIDPGVDISDSGLISFKFGISLYAPNASFDKGSLIEGVMVFEKEYYGSAQ